MEKKNPAADETTCSICNLPLDPYAEKGWFDHVVDSEHLFLRNIYSHSQIKTMSIDDVDEYKENLYWFLNILIDFEDALQHGNATEEVMDFIREDLCGAYDTFSSLRQAIEKISLPKRPFSRKQELFHEKIVAFLYSNLISFCITDKVKGIPIS